ncbi:MAG: glutamine-hydrolyzing GMP synthase [Zetaproteobacteria bacterium]|nr:glutamine-hydrolyzing GMP synthase [Zetaproteobacteria bacterium]
MTQHRPDSILIIDFGSQYTHLITKQLRKLGFFTTTIAPHQPLPPQDIEVRGIILSGGPNSVHTEDAPSLPSWVIPLNKPILGICYGMQLLVNHFGGQFSSGDKREFGPSSMRWDVSEAQHLPAELELASQVWMSHCDHLDQLPTSFTTWGTTTNGVIAAISHTTQPILGVQFHPEVEHSLSGKALLEAFATHTCKLSSATYFDSLAEQIGTKIRNQVGPQGHVLMAVSGGVDSTVSAVLLARALGRERVSCVMVDHGMMRAGEVTEVKNYFTELGVGLEVLDRHNLFFEQLAGVSDPEQKRKIIGQGFITCFEEWATGIQHSNPYTHLGQGTLYSDVIESAGAGHGAHTIKSHHNVGGLPEKLQLQLVEPLRQLFKDEVRQLGHQLKVPRKLLDRHPFPGPGLGIRVVGEVSPSKVAMLQQADKIFIDSLKREDLYHTVWQAGAILLPVQSVGVMGDQRTYEWTCVLRAVSATDAMTASVVEFPAGFLTQVASKIVNSVAGINRVLYDITSKPPATIEWE